MNGDEIDKFSQYYNTFVDYLPLFLAGATVSFITSVKSVYLERTRKQKIIKAVFDAFVTGSIAAATAMVLPLALENINPGIEFGVAVLTGRFGNSLLEAVLKAKFNYLTINPSHPEDLTDIREEMSKTARLEHVERCPFRDEHKDLIDDERCAHCQEKKEHAESGNGDGPAA